MRTSKPSPAVEVDVEVRRETEKAYLVFCVDKEHWIPKSQISDTVEENGKITAVFIPEWLANEKGLI
jgi:hypothetical protein